MSLQPLTPLVVSKNVANVHAEPNTSTELVTQAILGQPAWVMENRDGWTLVQLWDSYRGWIQARFTQPLEEGQAYPGLPPYAEVTSLITDLYAQPRASSHLITKLVITTRAALAAEKGSWAELRLPDGRNGWVRRSSIDIVDGEREQNVQPSVSGLVKQARRFVGTPYLWGGTTPFGIDCSGFMQLVYRLNGCRLLRDAGIQASDPRAKPVDSNKIKKGDLIYFCAADDTHRQKITHTGMYIGDGEFIHAAGQSVGVTTTKLFSGYYWDVFWGARRMEIKPE